MRRLLLVTVLLGVLAAPAHGYEIGKIVPQPKINYYVALPDWKKPMKRVVRALNRGHVGVKLVLADIPEQASIQVGRLEHTCGLPGVDGTTQTLEGGYAAIYLPRGCNPTQASIIAAHELGHALGLEHEDDRCALMNSSGTGSNSIPTNCLGASYPWLRKPFRGDDLAGLRKLFRNTKPKVKLRLTGPATVPTGTSVTFAITASDRQQNLSEMKVTYGDGTSDEVDAIDSPPTSHLYTTPGTYTIRVTVSDFYRKRATSSVKVTVT